MFKAFFSFSSLSFSFSLLSAQPISFLFLLLSPFSSHGPRPLPTGPSPRPGPTRRRPLPQPTDRRGPPVRVVPDLGTDRDSPESGRAPRPRRACRPWPARQGAAPRPINSARTTPLNPTPQLPPPPQTLAREPPWPSSELRVAPPVRRFPSMFSLPRRFVSW